MGKNKVSHQAVSQPRCCILEREISPQKSVNVVFIKKHHGVFSHGGGKNTTLVERGKITSEINGFANVSLLALAKPTMIKFLFVSCCLHPSPPRSLPVTLEQKKNLGQRRCLLGQRFSASSPDSAASTAAVAARRRRWHPTEEWSAPGRWGDSLAVSLMLNRMLMLTEWGISAFTETRRWLPPLAAADL